MRSRRRRRSRRFGSLRWEGQPGACGVGDSDLLAECESFGTWVGLAAYLGPAMDPCLELLNREIEAALAGLSVEQTQLRPGGDPARWCAQQIVGHLRLTYGATSVAMETRIGRGTPTKARASVAQRVGQWMVVGMQRFPGGRKAPEMVTVALDEAALDGAGLAAGVGAEIVRMDGLIVAVEGMFGGRSRCVSHMVLGPMRVGQWRRFHLVHGRHHLRQVWAVRREFGV